MNLDKFLETLMTWCFSGIQSLVRCITPWLRSVCWYLNQICLLVTDVTSCISERNKFSFWEMLRRSETNVFVKNSKWLTAWLANHKFIPLRKPDTCQGINRKKNHGLLGKIQNGGKSNMAVINILVSAWARDDPKIHETLESLCVLQMYVQICPLGGAWGTYTKIGMKVSETVLHYCAGFHKKRTKHSVGCCRLQYQSITTTFRRIKPFVLGPLIVSRVLILLFQNLDWKYFDGKDLRKHHNTRHFWVERNDSGHVSECLCLSTFLYIMKFWTKADQLFTRLFPVQH